MREHPNAGGTVTLLIDGEEEEFTLEEGISYEEGEDFINSMLGVEVPEQPTEVDHPDLEFADIPLDESPESDGLRLVCKTEGCDHTEVFESFDGIRNSEWTEVELPTDYLTDMTELHYAFCKAHSLSEEEGYNPKMDFGSHEFGI